MYLFNIISDQNFSIYLFATSRHLQIALKCNYITLNKHYYILYYYTLYSIIYLSISYSFLWVWAWLHFTTVPWNVSISTETYISTSKIRDVSHKILHFVRLSNRISHCYCTFNHFWHRVKSIKNSQSFMRFPLLYSVVQDNPASRIGIRIKRRPGKQNKPLCVRKWIKCA